MTKRSNTLLGAAGIVLAGLALGGCGGGGFDTAAVPLCGDTQLNGIAVLDFNGDGADDVAAGCHTRHDPLRGHLEIWLSDGAGALSKTQSLPLGDFEHGGEGAGPITAADFNEDGHPDLVVTDAAGTTHGVSVLYGKSGGRFGSPTYFERPSISWVATSDINGDGHTDLIPVSSAYGSGARHYIPGSGGTINAGAHPRLVAHDTRGYKGDYRVDLNADGRSDVVISQPRAGRLHVFASGEKAHDVVLGKAVRQVQRVFSGADVDGDGAVDLLVATRRSDGGHDTRWVLTDGGPHLSDPIAAVPHDAEGVYTADFNGDGVTDLWVLQGYKPDLKYHGGAHPLLLMGKAGGGYTKPQKLALPGSPNGEFLGDFNGDGKSDFLYRRISKDDAQGVVYLSQH